MERVRIIGFCAALAAALPMQGCDNQQAKAPPKAILMVTWLVPSQPPQSTQTVMSDMPACLTAQQNAIAAGESARAERRRLNELDEAAATAVLSAEATTQAHGGMLSVPSADDVRKLRGEAMPQVSAYCISQ